MSTIRMVPSRYERPKTSNDAMRCAHYQSELRIRVGTSTGRARGGCGGWRREVAPAPARGRAAGARGAAGAAVAAGAAMAGAAVGSEPEGGGTMMGVHAGAGRGAAGREGPAEGDGYAAAPAAPLPVAPTSELLAQLHSRSAVRAERGLDALRAAVAASPAGALNELLVRSPALAAMWRAWDTLAEDAKHRGSVAGLCAAATVLRYDPRADARAGGAVLAGEAEALAAQLDAVAMTLARRRLAACHAALASTSRLRQGAALALLAAAAAGRPAVARELVRAGGLDFGIVTWPRLAYHPRAPKGDAADAPAATTKRKRGSRGGGAGGDSAAAAAARWSPSHRCMGARTLRGVPTRALFVDLALALLQPGEASLARAALSKKVLAAGLLHGLARDPPRRAALALRALREAALGAGGRLGVGGGAAAALAGTAARERRGGSGSGDGGGGAGVVPSRLMSVVFGDAAIEQLATIAARGGGEAAGGGGDGSDGDGGDGGSASSDEAVAAYEAAAILTALLTDASLGLAPPQRAVLSHTGVRGCTRALRVLRALRPSACAAHARVLLGAARAAPCLAAAYLAELPMRLEPRLAERWLTSMSIVGQLVTAASAQPPGAHAETRAGGGSGALAAAADGVGAREGRGATLSCLAAAVLPPAASKAALSRGLQHSSLMVRYATVGLLLRSLAAFEALCGDGPPGAAAPSVRTRAGEGLGQALRERLRERLPDAQTLVAALSASACAHATSLDAAEASHRPALLRSRLLELFSRLAISFPEVIADAKLDAARLLPAHAGAAPLGECVAAVRLLRAVSAPGSGESVSAGVSGGGVHRALSAHAALAALRTMRGTRVAWLHDQARAVVVDALHASGACVEGSGEAMLWLDAVPPSSNAMATAAEEDAWDESDASCAVLAFFAQSVAAAIKRAGGGLDADEGGEGGASALSRVVLCAALRYCSPASTTRTREQRCAVACYAASVLALLLHRSHALERPALATAWLESVREEDEPTLADVDVCGALKLLRMHCRAAVSEQPTEEASILMRSVDEARATEARCCELLRKAPVRCLPAYFDPLRPRQLHADGLERASLSALRSALPSTLLWTFAAAKEGACDPTDDGIDLEDMCAQALCGVEALAGLIAASGEEEEALDGIDAPLALLAEVLASDTFTMITRDDDTSKSNSSAHVVQRLTVDCISRVVVACRSGGVAIGAARARAVAMCRTYADGGARMLRARIEGGARECESFWCDLVRHAGLEATFELVRSAAKAHGSAHSGSRSSAGRLFFAALVEGAVDALHASLGESNVLTQAEGDQSTPDHSSIHSAMRALFDVSESLGNGSEGALFDSRTVDSLFECIGACMRASDSRACAAGDAADRFAVSLQGESVASLAARALGAGAADLTLPRARVLADLARGSLAARRTIVGALLKAPHEVHEGALLLPVLGACTTRGAALDATELHALHAKLAAFLAFTLCGLSELRDSPQGAETIAFVLRGELFDSHESILDVGDAPLLHALPIAFDSLCAAGAAEVVEAVGEAAVAYLAEAGTAEDGIEALCAPACEFALRCSLATACALCKSMTEADGKDVDGGNGAAASTTQAVLATLEGASRLAAKCFVADSNASDAIAEGVRHLREACLACVRVTCEDEGLLRALSVLRDSPANQTETATQVAPVLERAFSALTPFLVGGLRHALGDARTVRTMGDALGAFLGGNGTPPTARVEKGCEQLLHLLFSHSRFLALASGTDVRPGGADAPLYPDAIARPASGVGATLASVLPFADACTAVAPDQLPEKTSEAKEAVLGLVSTLVLYADAKLAVSLGHLQSLVELLARCYTATCSEADLQLHAVLHTLHARCTAADLPGLSSFGFGWARTSGTVVAGAETDVSPEPRIDSWRCALTVANFPFERAYGTPLSDRAGNMDAVAAGGGTASDVEMDDIETDAEAVVKEDCGQADGRRRQSGGGQSMGLSGALGCHLPSLAPFMYDPLHVLRYAAHALGTRGLDAAREISLNGLFAVALMALAAVDTELRSCAYTVVTLFMTLVDGATAEAADDGEERQKTSNKRGRDAHGGRSARIAGARRHFFREAPQLEMLLRSLQNAVSAPLMRLPALSAAFAAEASCVLSHPASAHYAMLNNYLLRRPALDLSAVPLFFAMFGSATHALATDRAWALRLLLVGVGGAEDTKILRRLFVAELLMSGMGSSYLDPQVSLAPRANACARAWSRDVTQVSMESR